MINSLALGLDALSHVDENSGLYSDHMLYELMAGHEELIARELVKRQQAIGATSFIMAMIDYHETAAALPRVQFEGAEWAPVPVEPGTR
jgi:hypothetical protein